MLGTRHSFNTIADAERLISLDALPDEVVVDTASGTVELNPAMTYGRLAPMLHERGLALHNLASLPHISVGGAIATARTVRATAREPRHRGERHRHPSLRR